MPDGTEEREGSHKYIGGKPDNFALGLLVALILIAVAALISAGYLLHVGWRLAG